MTDPVNTTTASLGDRLAILPKLWSTYAALIGGALIAAPVDWAHFDFKALSINQVVLALIWLVGYFTARVKTQTNTTP